MFDFIGRLIASPFICLGWVIVGIAAGWLARRLVGGGTARSSCFDFVLGIGGAIVGGIVVSFFNADFPTGGLALVAVNLGVATLGAVILILIGRVLSGARR